MINFNTPKLAKNNTSGTLDFSSANIQSVKEVDILFSEPSPITIKPDSGFLGMGEVVVNHPPVEEVTEVVINKAGKQRITPSEGYDATQAVDVDVQAAIKTVDITKNGTYGVTGPLKQVTVNVDVEQQAAVDLSTGVKFAYSTFVEVPFELTGSIVNANYLFYYCENLTSIPLFDTSKVTELLYAFGNCDRLKSIPLLDFSSVTLMNSTFYRDVNLKSVPLFNTSKVTEMGSTFYGCSLLTSIPQFDTSKVTSTRYMLGDCTALTSVPKLDFSKVTNAGSMFDGDKSLTTLGGFTGLKTSLNLSGSTLLTKESILNVFNEAATVTGKTLTLGSINLAKLTDEEKAIATNKGWTLA